VFDNSILTKSALGEPWKVSKVQRQLLPSEQIELEKLEISSFLVIQNDSILFEKYWGKHQPSTVTNSFSAAKTFVGLLIGCALKDQSIKSIDEPVGNYIPSFSIHQFV
jgi:CubicO group peptidase (beta-lactamase class C family)